MNVIDSGRPILLVEDDIIDAMTVKRALKEIRVANEIITRQNGEEALEYLRNTENRRPSLILLDLNMPKMNGIEFLQIAKTDESLQTIPIIILTTSQEEKDRVATFRFGVAGYMLKPVDYQQFVETMKTIKVYWTLSQLPE